jgi:twitching motility two-component system response regulator PilH
MVRSILLIDDEPDFVDTLSLRLQANGYDVIGALSGEKGIEVARNQRVDVILLDIIMPDMNGFEVLKKLQEDEKTRQIPVVVLSNAGDTKFIFEAERLGARDYVLKTADSTEMLDSIERVLPG